MSVLVGGTAFGQAIALLILPLLTRLYSPADFSVLAVYAALIGVLGLVACLRFDIAIPLPQRVEDAFNLLSLSLLIAVVMSLAIALPCLLAPEWLASLINQPAMRPYFWLVPIGVLMMATFSALQFWVTRNKNFSLIAKTRVKQAIGGSATQLGFGWFGLAPLGLMVGQVMLNGAGAFGLGLRTFKESRALIASVNFREMARLAKEYDRFPKYSSLEAFANNAAIQIPVLIIAGAALGPEAGYLALAMRVMQAPMGLIGGAIGQVFFSRAPEEMRNRRLGEFTADTIAGLLKSGVGPLIFAGCLAPVLFGPVFGAEWARAGVLVAWMTPWFIFQFIVSPVSMALHVTNNQRKALLLQIFGLALRVGFVFAAIQFYRSAVTEVFAVTGAVFYMIYLFVVLAAVGSSFNELTRRVKGALIFVLPWAIAGGVFHFTFGKLLNGFY